MKLIQNGGTLEINGTGNLVLTRNEIAITLTTGVSNVFLNGWSFFMIDGFKSRLRATWGALRFIWG